MEVEVAPAGRRELDGIGPVARVEDARLDPLGAGSGGGRGGGAPGGRLQPRLHVCPSLADPDAARVPGEDVEPLRHAGLASAGPRAAEGAGLRVQRAGKLLPGAFLFFVRGFIV